MLYIITKIILNIYNKYNILMVNKNNLIIYITFENSDKSDRIHEIL